MLKIYFDKNAEPVSDYNVKRLSKRIVKDYTERKNKTVDHNKKICNVSMVYGILHYCIKYNVPYNEIVFIMFNGEKVNITPFYEILLPEQMNQVHALECIYYEEIQRRV